MSSQSCSYDHVIWTVLVGFDTCRTKLSQLTVPRRNDVSKMDELLVWKDPGVFMRPTFRQADNGLTATQCFWDWDTKGVSLPEELIDPERLSDLVQAKKNREFTIDEWKDTYWGVFEQNSVIKTKRREYPIPPEEYFSHPGMTIELFRKLFKRDPMWQ